MGNRDSIKITELDLSTRKALQDLARHKMIVSLYANILIDMRVCEIEGWDKMEFIRQIQDAIEFAKVK